MDIQALLGLATNQPKPDAVIPSEENTEAADVQRNSFFDMLFGRTENGTNILSGFLQSEGAAVNENGEVQVFNLSKADFNRLKAENPEIAALIEKFSIDISAALESTVALNQQALGQLSTNGENADTIKIQLSDAIIKRAEGDDLSLADIFLLQLTGAPIPADVHTPLLNDANPVQTVDGAGTPERNLLAYINMNLTPEQIARLQSENAEDDPALAALAGLVRLVTPQQTSGGTQGSNTAQAAAANTNNANGVAGAVDPALTGGTGENSAEGEGDSQFLSALKANNANERVAARQTGGNGNNAADARANVNVNVKAAMPQGQGLPALPMVDPLLSGDQTGIFAQDIDGQFSVSQSLNAVSSAASHVTQTASATAAHPATQMVAATIHKSAVNKQSTNITLRLDPPELGRIEVRMDFDKDNKMKATLLVEKPETHLMLQRDAHALERALDQAGIDTADGNALNFELAQDGHEFGQNGGHDSHAGQGGSKASDDDLALIESSMTWAFNPETGHTHYSILA